MVKGVELFRKHFRAFTDRYVLIGGTACDLILTEVGLEFRATKDLDIVLCVETLDAEFARAFWAFVKAGGYKAQETDSGARRFYRFTKPSNAEYPTMLELFCRAPDALNVAEGGGLTPIAIDDAVSSLSAILLDEAYYKWIHAGKQIVDGVPVVRAEHLIPLKAKAWLDLRERRESGRKVDSADIKKHRNDVFRLFAVIDPEFRATLAPSIATDIRRFLDDVGKECVELKTFGLRERSEQLGKFRAYLLTALGRYLIDKHRIDHGRPGSLRPITIPTDQEVLDSIEPDESDDPVQAYGRQWATTALNLATERVEADCRRRGLDAHWAIYEARILRPACSVCDPVGVDELASVHGVREAEVYSMLNTVKRKMRNQLESIVLETLEDPADLDRELDELRLVLSSSVT